MPKEKISLVLGSGGARGYAHIGVIEELEKIGYEVHSISGSSMGALVGALYACGKMQEFKEWILTLDTLSVIKLIDFTFSGKGLIGGDKVFRVIEEMIGDITIEELPIAFTAVATDIIKQKEVWIQKGSLIDAVRASVAIPTLFTPKKIENHYFIDGGVLNPLPIAPTISDLSDVTIAVTLNDRSSYNHAIEIPEHEHLKRTKMKAHFIEMTKKAEKLFFKDEKSELDGMGMFDVMGKTIDIMQNAVLDCKMAGYSPDILIGIPNDACGFYEFNRAYEMIELGRVITEEKLASSI